MSVHRCEHCGHCMLDPEHACTAMPALTAELLHPGRSGDAAYEAWLDLAETRVAIRLRILPRGGAR